MLDKVLIIEFTKILDKLINCYKLFHGLTKYEENILVDFLKELNQMLD